MKIIPSFLKEQKATALVCGHQGPNHRTITITITAASIMTDCPHVFAAQRPPFVPILMISLRKSR